MVKRKKYLWRHPSGRIYVRLNGKLSRIVAAEGTADFDREYWEVVTGKAVVSKTSLRALIADYRKSDRWTRLKPRTRKDYERVLAYIEEVAGGQDVKRLTRAHVIASQAANRHRTRFANYIPQVMVVLCEHAIDLAWIKENPAKGVRALDTPKERRQAHVPWPDWAVKKFRAEASPLPLLIFELGVGSVQRPDDWCKFTWGDYDGANLRTEQGKTGIKLTLPCTPQLKAALDDHKGALGVSPLPSRPILTTTVTADPMKYFYMAKIMLAERRRLDLEAYDLHAMRYRGVMELAWAGCTDDEIASFSGHRTRAMIEKYAGEARQIMRARQAQDKRK